ncbi:MAG: hypothetical protein ACLFV7_05765 [Phycisphaerae bacterium]
MRSIVTCAFVVLAWAAVTAGQEPGEKLDRLREQQREVDTELRTVNDAIEILRRAASSDTSGELAAARKQLQAAEKATEKAHTEAGLDELKLKLRAAQKARDEKAMEIITASKGGKRIADTFDEIGKRIEQMEGRIGELSTKEVVELARLHRRHRHLGRKLYDTRRSVWERKEVLGAYRQADAAYKAYGRARKKSKAYGEATDREKQARRKLDRARSALDLKSDSAQELLAEKKQLEAKQKQLDRQASALGKELLSGAKEVSIMVPMPPRKGKERKPRKATLWIPPGDKPIRGVIAAHPMISKMATHPRIRQAAARAGLATMVMPSFSYRGEDTMERFDAMMKEFAKKADRPDLPGAAILPAGLSASVLAARNVGYAAPDRTIGIVHVAGGNMHHNIVDPDQSLSGVPFIAMNGEFEWCGPEGGIRPEYGRQTQWVMIREQLLRRWRSDHQHLMSLVVVPGGDHGDWDVGLAAMFVEKAAKYRLPAGERDLSRPVKCVKIKAEKGWLTDADLDHPEHKPAAFDEYTGDRDDVFWHFDKEMAEAVYEYHEGEFLLPDPTKQHPVPDSWPKKRGINLDK